MNELRKLTRSDETLPNLVAQRHYRCTSDASSNLRAEDTNVVELIKQLQKRIEELEQKVNTLERGKGATEPAKDAQAKQRTEELDQKARILQRERELDEEAAQAKPSKPPKSRSVSRAFRLSSANTNFALQLKGCCRSTRGLSG